MMAVTQRADLERVVLAAGGTAGHIFPALSLYQRLIADGVSVTLLTDDRGTRYTGDFADSDVRVLPSGGIVTGSITTRIRNVAKLASGYLKARSVVKELAPDAVIGMGGYAAVGPLLVAQQREICNVLCEQNSVMGLANKVAARRAAAIALSFDPTEGARGECMVTGNPSRPDVIAVGEQPFPRPGPDDRIGVLVMGGSQGARSISVEVPAALAALDESLRSRLDVIHQARPEDADQVSQIYSAASIAVEIDSFIDVPAALTRCHLMVGRSGASTVCDTAVARRAAVYLPLLTHSDLQQVKNAQAVVDAGGALIHREDEGSAEDLSRTLGALLSDTDRLESMAESAFAWSRPDAADAILALVAAQLVVAANAANHG